MAVKGQITQGLTGYTSEVSAAIMLLNKQPLRLCGLRRQAFIYPSWVSRARLWLYRPRPGSWLWAVLRTPISVILGPRLKEEQVPGAGCSHG